MIKEEYKNSRLANLVNNLNYTLGNKTLNHNFSCEIVYTDTAIRLRVFKNEQCFIDYISGISIEKPTKEELERSMEDMLMFGYLYIKSELPQN